MSAAHSDRWGRRRRGRGSRRLLLVACTGLLAWATGCAEPGFDLATLEARYPRLRELAPHRLGDTQPYALPLGGRATLFLCRWPDAEPIGLALPDDATRQQRAAMLAAVDAWQRAGLGVRFGPPPAARLGIRVRLRDDITRTQANTIADCRVDLSAAGAAPDGDVIPARLVFASIDLARQDLQLTGTLLHELGHALGYQGHATRGRTIMRASPSEAAEQGRRVRAGKAFEDVALRALYAVPSGTVLARLPLHPQQTAPIDGLARLAPRGGLTGPYARVGDRGGLVFWRDASGRRAAVALVGLRRARSDPSALRLEPDARARGLLEGSAAGR